MKRIDGPEVQIVFPEIVDGVIDLPPYHQFNESVGQEICKSSSNLASVDVGQGVGK